MRNPTIGISQTAAVTLPSAGEPPVHDLTAKERDVLALLAAGYSNEHIAERLEVTSRTVETHTRHIFAKLGLEADPTLHRRVLAVLAHLGATSHLDVRMATLS